MGKRKQECPRKLAEPGSDVSKLESIVKKLKTNPILTNSKASAIPEEAAERTLITPNCTFVSCPSATKEEHTIHNKSSKVESNEVEPLDLRLPRSLTTTDNHKIPTMKQATQLVTNCHPSNTTFHSKNTNFHWIDTNCHPSNGNLSSKNTNCHSSNTKSHSSNRNLSSKSAPDSNSTSTIVSFEPNPREPATSFQELSAKLEQYFSTGIAASKFPRKMVRGQDMWMQDIEQKRRILKCLKCGCSYNTLGELARHIKKSGHHNEVSILAVESATVEPIRPSGSRVENSKIQEEKISRGPSAFRPVQRSAGNPSRETEHSEKNESRRNFSHSIEKLSNLKQENSSKNVKFDHKPATNPPSRNSSKNVKSDQKPRTVLPSRNSSKNSEFGQNGFFHGFSVFSSDFPTRLNFSPREKNSSNDLTKTAVRFPERKNSSPKLSGLSRMENESPQRKIQEKNFDFSIKEEKKIESDQEQKEDAGILVAPSNFTAESSPLFALKNFLDFGIPRLKPTGIDGGRV